MSFRLRLGMVKMQLNRLRRRKSQHGLTEKNTLFSFGTDQTVTLQKSYHNLVRVCSS